MFISIVRQLLNTLYVYEHRCSLLTPIEVKFLLKVDKDLGLHVHMHSYHFPLGDNLITFWTTLVQCDCISISSRPGMNELHNLYNLWVYPIVYNHTECCSRFLKHPVLKGRTLNCSTGANRPIFKVNIFDVTAVKYFASFYLADTVTGVLFSLASRLISG